MDRRMFVVGVVLACAPLGLSAAAAEKEDVVFTDSFMEDKADLLSTGKNTYFILEPGYACKYASDEDGMKTVLVITVLDETKNVDGVETRVVEERETVNGKLAEVSRNYFAISKRTNSVYYFGEDSKEYKDDKVVSQGGSWESGVKGAKYGMMMPGNVLIGARHYQEIAPGEAMDRAEITSTTVEIETPAGKFTNCLKVRETTPLEPGNKEYKYYAPGVGLIKDGDLVLQSYGKADKAAAAPSPAAKP
jgi:hypothetical protein